MFSPATSPSAGATADFTANLAPVLAAGFVAEVQLTVVFSMDERFFSHVGVGPAGWFDGGAFFEGKFQSSEASFKMKFRPEKITSGIKWFVEGKGEAARRKFHVLGCHFPIVYFCICCLCLSMSIVLLVVRSHVQPYFQQR